jgi:hypothetical protein
MTFEFLNPTPAVRLRPQLPAHPHHLPLARPSPRQDRGPSRPAHPPQPRPADRGHAKREHPYEVPSVVAIPIIDGGPDYIAWILEQTEQPA